MQWQLSMWCSPRDANPKCRSSGIWNTFFRNLGTFSGIPNISQIKCCNVTKCTYTRQASISPSMVPSSSLPKHSWQLYFVFIFYFQFRNFNGFFLSRHDGDSHPGHHARWKSLSYKLHRMRDYLRSLTALVLARDLCILGSTFATFYAFLLGKPFLSNHELGSQSCSIVLILYANCEWPEFYANKNIFCSVNINPKSANHDCSRRQIWRHFSQFSTNIRYDITWESSASRRFSWNIIPYWLFMKKRQILKLSSAANNRCRFKG